MQITLIYPSMGERVNAVQMEPLTMAVLAGLTPDSHQVRFYDDRIEEIPFEEHTDVVGISVHTFAAKRAYEIAAQFRNRGIKVILGGFHIFAQPNEAQEHADAIVIGEAERVWPKVLEDAARGRLQKQYQATRRSVLNGVKANRKIFRDKRYAPLSLVEFGRGCKHSCSFCSVKAFFGSAKVCRPVEEVVDEIAALDRKWIEFVDDNLVSDIHEAKKLFRKLIPLKIRWIAQAGIEIASDDELLRLAADSGCFGLLIGFESLDQRNLKQMRKTSAHSLDNFRAAIRKIHNHGIAICGSFLFGYDQDTADAFPSTLAFANEQRLLLALFNHLTPFPGTPLYEEMSIQKRLLCEKWWLSPGYHWSDVAFKPKHLSISELSEGCKRNRRLFYLYRNIVKRVSFKPNRRSLLIASAINYLIRKDLNEKRSFRLGRELLQTKPRQIREHCILIEDRLKKV